MAAQVAQVDRHQQQALGCKRRKQRNDAEVPDVPGVESCGAGGMLSKKQRQQNANGSKCAVGRNQDCADVEENGMHLCKNTACALSGVARR